MTGCVRDAVFCRAAGAGRRKEDGVMKNAKERQNPVKLIIIGCILAALIVGFYFYIANKMKGNTEENVKATKSQQVLMRNLSTNYPPSPREVLKYYCEIIQCLYNEPHTDEELKKLASQIQLLYDDEFVANQPEDLYLLNLAGEIAELNKKDMKISSYSTSSSTDVETFTRDNYEWARLYCMFNIRKGTDMLVTTERFLMRKDEAGHWKIYGWELAEN